MVLSSVNSLMLGGRDGSRDMEREKPKINAKSAKTLCSPYTKPGGVSCTVGMIAWKCLLDCCGRQGIFEKVIQLCWSLKEEQRAAVPLGN